MYEMDEEDYVIINIKFNSSYFIDPLIFTIFFTFHRQNYEVINQEYTVIGRLINNQINH